MGHIFMPTFTDCGAKVGLVMHVQCWSVKSFFEYIKFSTCVMVITLAVTAML